MAAPATHPDLDEHLPEKQIHMVRATYRLIGERGVHRVSLQEIADAAGVSKGLVPYYFKTKENLILATMRWVLFQVAERIRQAIAAAATPREQLLTMLDVIWAEPEANRRFYVVYLDLVEHAVRVHRFGQLSATFREVVDAQYAEVIRAGAANGTFRVQDVEEAAAAMRAVVEGLFLRWLQEDDWRGLHAGYRDRCKHAVLTYLGTT